LYDKIHNNFLLTTSSEVLVKVMYNRFSQHKHCNGILVPEHHGLRAVICTEDEAYKLKGEHVKIY
jgi:hypothetical protein